MSETKFTPGPWCWHGSNKAMHLATVDRGKTYVMSFRRMGMRGAQPAFQMSRRTEGEFGMVPAIEIAKFEVGYKSVTGYTDAKADDSVYRYDITHIDHPDAHLIAAAPDLYAALDTLLEDDLPWQKKHVEAARAALRKARGEAA